MFSDLAAINVTKMSPRVLRTVLGMSMSIARARPMPRISIGSPSCLNSTVIMTAEAPGTPGVPIERSRTAVALFPQDLWRSCL